MLELAQLGALIRAFFLFDFGFRYEGYSGLSDVRELTDAAALKYSIPKETLRFGTKESGCNMGLLVFRQGEEYGVIDFKRINDY